MGVVAAVAAVVGATTAVGGAVASNKAAKEQNKASEKARRAERAGQSLENARRVRAAIAERRIREAEITQAGFAQGIEGSSSVAGAVGALRSDTAGNVGAFNTQLSTNSVISDSLLEGASQFAKFQGIANTLGGISQGAGAIGSVAAGFAGPSGSTTSTSGKIKPIDTSSFPKPRSS